MPRFGADTVADIFNQTSPGADTSLITDYTPSSPGGVLRVTVQLASAAKLRVHVTRGAVEVSSALNGDTALTAGQLYQLTAGSTSDQDTYNFELDTDVTINRLLVERVLSEQF